MALLAVVALGALAVRMFLESSGTADPRDERWHSPK